MAPDNDPNQPQPPRLSPLLNHDKKRTKTSRKEEYGGDACQGLRRDALDDGGGAVNGLGACEGGQVDIAEICPTVSSLSTLKSTTTAYRPAARYDSRPSRPCVRAMFNRPRQWPHNARTRRHPRLQPKPHAQKTEKTKRDTHVQKSMNVSGNGPWVAIYRLLVPRG